MADTLTPETGAGLASADSYNNLSGLEAHFLAEVGTPSSGWTGVGDPAQCRLARLATRWMEARWGTGWVGQLAQPTTPQALSWPRSGALDTSGRLIASNVVPAAVKALHAWVTRFAAEGKLKHDEVSGQLVVAEAVGPISTSYDHYRRAPSFLDFLDGLAAPLLSSSGRGLSLHSNGG